MNINYLFNRKKKKRNLDLEMRSKAEPVTVRARGKQMATVWVRLLPPRVYGTKPVFSCTDRTYDQLEKRAFIG